MGIKILGFGKEIPQKCVSNDDFAGLVETSDEWISSRTGIKSRYVCTSETLTDLSVAAAKQAILKARLSPSEIDMIICSTIGGDYRTPSLACCVAERLDISCPAFDINAACSGFIYGLEVASSFLNSDKAENVLIICAEMLSTQMDWRDRSTCVLFGDGAAACVVTKGNAVRYIKLSVQADSGILNLPVGTGNSPYIAMKKEPDFIHMQGQEVFKFATGVVESELRKAQEALELSLDQIDYFILHQANKRIIDFTRTKLRQPKEKFPINIDRYGNISSVSIPLLMSEMLEDGKIKANDTLFISAFGAGMTIGSCVIVWE